MDQVDNERSTAQELVAYAQGQGFDLEPLRKDSAFQKNQRWVFLWRKLNALACSGRVEETEGALHYSLQGTISKLPKGLNGAVSAFHGMWSEAGTLENVDQMFELVKAWLLDWKEVDDLPARSVRRGGI
jgi:hypothetical protein